MLREYKPFFMIDDSCKDGHVETIMDYVLSWCFRCTNYRYVKEHQPILYRYCMYMLFKLLGKELDLNYTVVDRISVKKQQQKIDLWVEVDLKRNNKIEEHAILIENKYYSPIRDHQLETYKPIFDEFYADKPNVHLHYAAITCLYHEDTHYSTFARKAKENGFKDYFIYDLFDESLNGQESESEIFNEFFIREWL